MYLVKLLNSNSASKKLRNLIMSIPMDQLHQALINAGLEFQSQIGDSSVYKCTSQLDVNALKNSMTEIINQQVEGA